MRTATDSTPLLPELAQAGVVSHGAGTWVALPPTSTELVLRQRWWWTSPRQHPTWLRPTMQVQRVLLTALQLSGHDVAREWGDHREE